MNRLKPFDKEMTSFSCNGNGLILPDLLLQNSKDWKHESFTCTFPCKMISETESLFNIPSCTGNYHV